MLSVGSAFSFASVISSASFASLGSALSGLSRWSMMAWRGDHSAPETHPDLRVVPDEPELRDDSMHHTQT